MGVTNYPNGISSEGTAHKFGVTSVTGAGTVATGLTTVTGVTASLLVSPGTAGGSAAFVSASVSSGNIILKTWQYDAVTAGTVAQNVAWTAFGAA